jgi:hypothetical protein
MADMPKAFVDYINKLAGVPKLQKEDFQGNFPQGVLITDEPWDLPSGGFGEHDGFQADHASSRYWSLRFIKPGRTGVV